MRRGAARVPERALESEPRLQKTAVSRTRNHEYAIGLEPGRSPIQGRVGGVATTVLSSRAMGIHTEWLRYGDRNQYLGYAAHVDRAELPLPGVLVLQEAGGVDLHIQDVTRRIAAAGYAAFAPDLFSVEGVRPPALTAERMAEILDFIVANPLGTFGDPEKSAAALAKEPPERAARLRESAGAMLGHAMNLDPFVPELRAAFAFLRTGHEASKGQKVGAVGFCMGGGLSGLLACHEPELAAAAIFYGMPPAVGLASGVRAPVLGFYGGPDKRITDQVPAFAEAMRAAGKRFEYHVYEHAQHAFFSDARQAYHAGASRDAWARLLGFFRAELEPAA
jgi:carboxymethylenebutenolidase